MKYTIALGVLVTLGCGADDDPGPGPGGTGEPTELAGTLAAHNQVRVAHAQEPLIWDDALAVIAANWAAECVDVDAPLGLIDHNDGRSDTYPEYVGENIYGSSGAATGPAAVEAWAAEEADYNLASNTCSGVCGHYTQIVWGTTTKVGCAMHTCPGLTFGTSIVCNYAPGGNINGQRPY